MDRPGKLIARALNGAWRNPPPPLPLDRSEIEVIAPLLLRSGGGALLSTLLGKPADEDSDPVLHPLADAYRMTRLRLRDFEQRAAAVARLLRDHGIEPLLIKGISVAYRYADPAVRPFGDIDFCVEPSAFAKAAALLRDAQLGTIDLHEGCPDLPNVPWAGIALRSRDIDVCGTRVRTLGDTDTLKMLAVHFAKHGGYRAIWLCDIAACLESVSADLDWDLFLSGARVPVSWAVASVGLARELLAANVSDAPAEVLRPLPRWLTESIFDMWENPYRWPGGRPVISDQLSSDPLSIGSEIRRRWPNALESTVAMHAPVSSSPRFPLQMLHVFAKILAVPRQAIQIAAARRQKAS